jgi:hypothetical protein
MRAGRAAAGQRRHEDAVGRGDRAKLDRIEQARHIRVNPFCCDGVEIGRYRAPCTIPGPQEKLRPRNRAYVAAGRGLLAGNVALAFGPWFVRLADVGPVAAGSGASRSPRLCWSCWPMAPRGALPPALRALGCDRGRRDRLRRRSGGWHLGILRTTLANATLFGNSATLMFPIYGFLAARAWPTGRRAGAGAGGAGAALLLGRSYELSPKNLAGDLLCLAAGTLYTVYFILMARVRARWRRFRRWRSRPCQRRCRC